MDQFLLKLGFAALILCIALVFGFLAINSKRDNGTKHFLSYSESFAGGIFLGVGLLHILPHALEHFRMVYPHSHFPWMMLLTCLSIVFLTMIEKMLPLPKADDGSRLLPLLVACVLSVHSLFAGLALGMDRHFYSIFLLFVAIIAHKGAAAFALGISMRCADFTMKRMQHIIILFAMMTPIGIVAGSSLTTFFSSQQALLTESIFDAIAAGTFIYIACSHRGLDEQHNSLVHITSYLGGLALMALVAVWI